MCSCCTGGLAVCPCRQPAAIEPVSSVCWCVSAQRRSPMQYIAYRRCTKVCAAGWLYSLIHASGGEMRSSAVLLVAVFVRGHRCCEYRSAMVTYGTVTSTSLRSIEPLVCACAAPALICGCQAHGRVGAASACKMKAAKLAMSGFDKIGVLECIARRVTKRQVRYHASCTRLNAFAGAGVSDKGC
jgi:hypothetical protein